MTHDLLTLPGGTLIHYSGCWCRDGYRTSAPAFTDHRDSLGPAAGIVAGVLLAVALWGLLFGLCVMAGVL